MDNKTHMCIINDCVEKRKRLKAQILTESDPAKISSLESERFLTKMIANIIYGDIGYNFLFKKLEYTSSDNINKNPANINVIPHNVSFASNSSSL